MLGFKFERFLFVSFSHRHEYARNICHWNPKQTAINQYMCLIKIVQLLQIGTMILERDGRVMQVVQMQSLKSVLQNSG